MTVALLALSVSVGNVLIAESCWLKLSLLIPSAVACSVDDGITWVNSSILPFASDPVVASNDNSTFIVCAAVPSSKRVECSLFGCRGGVVQVGVSSIIGLTSIDAYLPIALSYNPEFRQFILVVADSGELKTYRSSDGIGWSSWLVILDSLGLGAAENPKIFSHRGVTAVVCGFNGRFDIASTYTKDGGFTWSPLNYTTLSSSHSDRYPSITAGDTANGVVWLISCETRFDYDNVTGDPENQPLSGTTVAGAFSAGSLPENWQKPMNLNPSGIPQVLTAAREDWDPAPIFMNGTWAVVFHRLPTQVMATFASELNPTNWSSSVVLSTLPGADTNQHLFIPAVGSDGKDRVLVAFAGDTSGGISKRAIEFNNIPVLLIRGTAVSLPPPPLMDSASNISSPCPSISSTLSKQVLTWFRYGLTRMLLSRFECWGLSVSRSRCPVSRCPFSRCLLPSTN